MRAPRLVLTVALALAVAAPALPAAAASPSGVVMSEFRFRGPAGAADEFVELHNTGTTAVDISGWALQGCAAASGAPSGRTTVPAGTSLPAGAHYLFGNTGFTSTTVTADATYGTGVSDTGGARIVDAAGAFQDGVGAIEGAVDECREGAGLDLPTTGGVAAFERLAEGTTDTDDNVADFAGPEPGDPQSLSQTPPPPPEVVPINEIQGPGDESPLEGDDVVVEGVVTGVDDEIGASFTGTFPEDAGIFIQSLPEDVDDNPATSEGIFIGFVRDRGAYPPGTVIRTSGEVREKFGFTIVSEAFGLEPEILGTAPVPEPVTIDPVAAAEQSAAGREYYETLEGMRVRLAVGTANSGGTNKFGELFLTPGTLRRRVFRDDPARTLLATDADAGAGDPNNPFKPERPSTTLVQGDLFDVARDVVGPFAFSFGNYKVMVQPDRLPSVSDGPTAFPYDVLSTSGPNELRVASFNVENFFPVGVELDLSPVTEEEYASKRDRIVDAIDRLLRRPEVVAVQEVERKEILEEVAAQLGGYTAYLEPGNDERGIDVGFLVADRVEVGAVTQYGKDAAGPEGFTCSDIDGGLYDRPPLAIEIAAGDVDATVFSNHFSSKSAPDQCRTAQAAFLEDVVADIEAGGREVIVAGDLNAFEDESALAELTDGETSLRNLWDQAPQGERYSFQFNGRLQTLDHILVTDGLAERVLDMRYAHFDNDYYRRFELAGDGHHVSDHDPPVVTLSAPSGPCPDPDTRRRVVVEGRATDVPNRDIGDGCTINDVLPRRDDYRNRGRWLRAFRATTRQLERDDVISRREREQLNRAAQRTRP